jgi:hypothetical protein
MVATGPTYIWSGQACLLGQWTIPFLVTKGFLARESSPKTVSPWACKCPSFHGNHYALARRLLWRQGALSRWPSGLRAIGFSRAGKACSCLHSVGAPCTNISSLSSCSPTVVASRSSPSSARLPLVEPHLTSCHAHAHRPSGPLVALCRAHARHLSGRLVVPCRARPHHLATAAP